MSDALRVTAYIVHQPGHRGSDGKLRPWVIKSHETGKLLGSYTSHPAAEQALRAMQYYKHADMSLTAGDSVYNWSPPDSPTDYTAHTPIPESELQYDVQKRTDTPSRYNTSGESVDKSKRDKDSMHRENMPYSEHDTTGWTDGMQPSSSPHGGTWDSPGSTAYEGEDRGMPASYSSVSSFCDRVFTPKPGWDTAQPGMFGDFIEKAATVITSCKREGLTREATRESVVGMYAALFSKSEWMTGVLNRFLDRAYGTAPQNHFQVESVETGIIDSINRFSSLGTPRREAEGAVLEQYAAWVENYPELRVIISEKLEAAYGARLASASEFTKFKKIKFLDSGRSGVILDVAASSPEKTELSIYWLDSGSREDVQAREENVVIQEPNAQELRRATEVADPPQPKAAALTVHHNVVNAYLTRFTSEFSELPITYSAFRGWCSGHQLSLPHTYELERVAVAMNYVKMPDTVVIFSEKKVYIADDNSAAEVVDVDPAKAPTEIKNKDGKNLKLKP